MKVLRDILRGPLRGDLKSDPDFIYELDIGTKNVNQYRLANNCKKIKIKK